MQSSSLSPRRRLAAIMFTDMVGFSKTAQRDEALALALLDEQQRIVRTIVAQYEGNEVDTIGDGFLVEFHSAVEAVRCAIDIQKHLFDRNLSESEERKILLRIGIHVGDVVFREDDVLGDGVNISARLEPLASPGGICLSEDVVRQVEGKIDARFRLLPDMRLKNISRSIRVFTVDLPWLPEPASGGPSLSAVPPLYYDILPRPSTTFVGREGDVTALRDILLKPATRIVTLTGPGGAGKTRLGLAVADSLRCEFAGGVCFVDLSVTQESDLVPSEIARTLGVPEGNDSTPEQDVITLIGILPLLMVLDNFEQVVEAAPSIGRIVAACPGLKVIVTTREALRLSHEQEYPVPPLLLADPSRLPPTGSLSQFAAVRLFIDRAVAVKPDFRVDNENAPAVAELCRRLDGLPLAIELAAARVKLLSPQAMLARLDRRLDLLRGGARDSPERHKTIRQTIAWSTDLLSEEERCLFRRMSVFVGGASLGAVEALTATLDGPSMDVFDVLGGLVDKSLVRVDTGSGHEGRFTLLETIREYAVELAVEAGEWEVARRAHAEYFVHLAETASPHLTGPDQVHWFDRLGLDRDNFQATFRFVEETDSTTLGVRLAQHYWRYWVVRDRLSFAVERLERLLGLRGLSAPTTERARMLTLLGTILHESSDLVRARSVLEESLALSRSVDDPSGLPSTLLNLGWVSSHLCDAAAAHAYSHEGLALCEAAGDRRGVAVAIHNLAWTAHWTGNLAEAEDLQRRSIAIREEVGDRRGVAYGKTALGLIRLARGDADEALRLVDEAGQVHRQHQDEQLLSWSLTILTLVHRTMGDLERARALIREAVDRLGKVHNHYLMAMEDSLLGLCEYELGNSDAGLRLLESAVPAARRAGSPFVVASSLFHLATALADQDRPREASEDLCEALEISLKAGIRALIPDCLEFAAVHLSRSDAAADSARLLGAAESLRRHTGAIALPAMQAILRARAKGLARELGDEAYDHQRSLGADLDHADAVRLAIDRLLR